jgi:glyoxylase-like metal-dependent hydrolase (beta-lactamase superfamily II)
VKYYVHPTSRPLIANNPWAKDLTDVPDRLSLTVGGTAMEIVFLGRAHTGGDLSLYLPRQRILFMSEAYLNRIFPAMRSAYPSEWVKAIERAQAMPVDVFVPGHGFVEAPTVLKEELETYRKAVLQVIAEGKRLHDAGVPVDSAVTQAKWGSLEDWTIRSSQAATAIHRVYLELEGKLPKRP